MPRLAVLIDADNISGKMMERIMMLISARGEPSIRRIYGDWSQNQLSGWKCMILDYAFHPIQQYRYAIGKNATDAALIIDAMDLLYQNVVDGFCLVSSDSDFTCLALRLREAGKIVIGLGNAQAPQAYRAACDVFYELEKSPGDEVERTASSGLPIAAIKVKKSRRSSRSVAVRDETEKTPPTDSSSSPILVSTSTKTVASLTAKPATATRVSIAEQQAEDRNTNLRSETEHMLCDIVRRIRDSQGWAGLSSIGAEINKINPDFRLKDMGHKKLIDLLRSYTCFEVEKRTIKRATLYYVRLAD